jgi:putative flippase GtrA
MLSSLLDKGLLSRFSLVTVVGFAVDFLVAFTLIKTAQVSAAGAASAGFVTGFVFNCILHDRFTFGSFSDRVSLKRGAGILAGALAALITRLLVIVTLEALLKPPADKAFLLILFAAGVSCVVNFTVSAMAVRRSEICPGRHDRTRVQA